MKLKAIEITTNIDNETILRTRGMGSSKKLQIFLANKVVSYCDPYVPMQQGTLKNSAKISRNGDTIIYPGPYAHYQYVGKVMAGRAPKHYTGADLNYNDAPLRGPQWDRRMLADRKDDIVQDVETFIRRKGK